MTPPEKQYDVIGIGNAIMDFLVEVDDQKLTQLNLKKGEFHLATAEQAAELLSLLSHYRLETVPGGSVANTIRAIAHLGGHAIFCGKVGHDQHGHHYINELEKAGVHSRLSKHPALTGHALAFITPDAQRTFSVHLGAAVNMAQEDLVEEDIKNSKILHLEGYQLEGPTREMVLQAITLAKSHDTLVSLDLSDPGVIRRNTTFLQELIKKYADIVFVNEEEARELTGFNAENAVRELQKLVSIAIVKRGEHGSFIGHKGTITRIDSFPATAIDTTGAGDTYAAGFLYGYCRGWTLEKAGRLGSLMAARIVEQQGVKIERLDGEGLKRLVDEK